MNATIKGVENLPTMEIVFFRCVFSILFSVFWLRHVKVPYKGTHTLLLVGRGLAGTTALYFFFLSIQNMPLASAVTIGYTSPIFTALLAVLFLKEKMRPVQWLFFGVSFLGVAALKGFDERVWWALPQHGLVCCRNVGGGLRAGAQLEREGAPNGGGLLFPVGRNSGRWGLHLVQFRDAAGLGLAAAAGNGCGSAFWAGLSDAGLAGRKSGRYQA